MEYAQLNEDGSYSHQITTHGNVEWDENNFCTAEALVKDGKAEQFRVVPLTETVAPAVDSLTQTVQRDGGEFVDGAWQYKWTVTNLDDAIIAQNLTAAKTQKWEAIKAQRDGRKAAGVKIGANWFHSDTDSRVQWLGLKDTARDMLAAGSAPTAPITLFSQPVHWKTLSGAFVPVTVQMALDVVQATKELDAVLFKAAEEHRAAMEASSNPVTYNSSTGWPLAFGE